MILEGIVTTLNDDATLNIAPMGPRVDPATNLAKFELRPYRSSTTYHNLKARGEGIFHVTDDVLLLAQTAIGVAASPAPETRPADVVAGRILVDACRYYEFRVAELDDREERTTIVVETAAQGRLRDFFGFNRARHAVLEAAILATRTEYLPLDEMLADFRKLAVLVDKTGGPRELRGLHALAPPRSRCGRAPRIYTGGGPAPNKMSDRLQIRTPSRLHFGLFGWGPEVGRQFGGIGLMIGDPGVQLLVEPAQPNGASADHSPRGSRRSSPSFVLDHSNPGSRCPQLGSASLQPRRSTSDWGSAPSSHWRSLARF